MLAQVWRQSGHTAEMLLGAEGTWYYAREITHINTDDLVDLVQTSIPDCCPVLYPHRYEVLKLIDATKSLSLENFRRLPEYLIVSPDDPRCTENPIRVRKAYYGVEGAGWILFLDKRDGGPYLFNAQSAALQGKRLRALGKSAIQFQPGADSRLLPHELAHCLLAIV